MVSIDPPRERECERCGRKEVWDGRNQTWVVAGGNGELPTGTPHCLHEWDISGNYNPVRTDG